jgi:pyruvate,water dikinase
MLRDGQLITVDGGRGIVTIDDGVTEQTGTGATERRGDKRRVACLPTDLLARSPADQLNALLVLPLDSVEAILDLAGGKGASLARMAAAGLPVPPGFHITTAAYRRFVADNGLQGTILTALADIDPNDVGALERASAAIRARFAGSVTPEPIAQAVRQAYMVLGAGDTTVAVRSSATAEDLPEMSFAGQQESYLNVSGEVALLESVKRCWASLWTARAVAYRARHGLRPEDVSLAVVVQELVLADMAGVLFTANPLTGALNQVVINATWGLGQALVGGLVTPDTLVVEKRTGAIVAQEIANKAVMTVRTADGTREEPVPTARRTQPALAAMQVAELARIGVRIEQLYGQPMDIEWAIQDGRIFIVQARPITALPEQVVAEHPPTD